MDIYITTTNSRFVSSNANGSRKSVGMCATHHNETLSVISKEPKSQDGLFHVCTSIANEELFYVCIYTVLTTGSEPKPTTSIVVMIPIYGNTNGEHRVPILTDVHDLVRTTGTRIDDHVYSIIDIYQMLW